MTDQREAEGQEWPVEIVRSAKRRKTVSAELRQGVLLVRAPDTLSDAELVPLIEKFRRQLAAKVRRPPQSDAELARRAQLLNERYFNGRFRWQSIRYVGNQNGRYGSCTPSRGTIRISDRLAAMPAWVRDYVIIHEMAHLEEANHGPRFWKLVNRYPLTERARGYLMAVGLEEMEGE